MRTYLKKIGFVIAIALTWSTIAAAEDFNMFSAIKLGGTFVQADLAGSWSMQALSMDGDDVLWLSADLVVGPSGIVTGTGTDSDGDDFDVVGGLLALNNFGIISGTLRINTTSFVVEEGTLDSAVSSGSQLNNYAVLITSCSGCTPDRSLLIYLTRSGFSGFTQNILLGRWQIFATGFENDTNRLLWIFGTFRIDSFGNVVTGSFEIENSRGQQGFFSSGQVLLEDNGRVTGFFEGTGSNDRSTFTGGQMTTDTNQITLVSADSKQEKLLIVLIRSFANQSGGLFADTDIDGSWHYYGIRFDTPATDADVSWEIGRLDMKNRGTITGADFAERDGPGGDITGDQIEVRVQGNLENGVIKLDGISRTVNAGQMNIPPFPDTSNPKTRFSFIGTDSGGSGGGGGGGSVGVLPGQGTGGNGCLISASADEPVIIRMLKRLEQR